MYLKLVHAKILSALLSKKNLLIHDFF